MRDIKLTFEQSDVISSVMSLIDVRFVNNPKRIIWSDILNQLDKQDGTYKT